MNRLRNIVATTLLILSPLCAVANPAGAPSEPLCDQTALEAPDWIRNRTIYEVNVRQYSEDGTFAAVEADLDRIQDLGIGVIWLMPIQPIGAVNRKGPLGSYYSVADYMGINSEFGDAESFRSLVDAAHDRDIKVIIDWVGNHTAWDNPLTDEHPEFFIKDAEGNFTPPHGTDWTDVIQLDFSNRELWDYMSKAMEYWIIEYDIDGFRCDYAVGLPTKFWNFASRNLRTLDPELFLLAESEAPDLNLHAFHASYGWPMHHTFNSVAKGDKSASAILDQFNRQSIEFPSSTLLLNFTTNHDENSWNGTTAERLGPAKRTFDTLVFTLPGIPLIYNGQEASLAKRLEFFERDPIDWSDLSEMNFYQELTALKASHPALSNPNATFARIPTDRDEQIFAFTRTLGNRQVTVISNLSADPIEIHAADRAIVGEHVDHFTGETTTLSYPAALQLQAWEFRVLTR
ncbi:Alpha amylase, catalytic domain subfamily [Verrucomicrobiia bacterium DG1235]|nr:Alpha amylase, catalytic domain subfamily [Verrucomicrobiae bacterium DG1235]